MQPRPVFNPPLCSMCYQPWEEHEPINGEVTAESCVKLFRKPRLAFAPRMK